MLRQPSALLTGEIRRGEAFEQHRQATSGRRLPGWRGRREAGLKTPGTDGRRWPARIIPDLR